MLFANTNSEITAFHSFYIPNPTILFYAFLHKYVSFFVLINFLLNLLGWHWFTKPYRFQVHNPKTHHLHNRLHVCPSPKAKSLSTSLPLLYPPPPSPAPFPSDCHQTVVCVCVFYMYVFVFVCLIPSPSFIQYVSYYSSLLPTKCLVSGQVTIRAHLLSQWDLFQTYLHSAKAKIKPTCYFPKWQRVLKLW